jgi:hypothetical protein
VLVLIMMILLLGFLELVIRIPQLQEQLVVPEMASRHYQFGLKVSLLEALRRTDGDVNCITLGSSIVDNGFDPVQFTETFEQETGKEINCFNFAIDALPTTGIAALAEILVQDYQPEILIYGAGARDLVIDKEQDDAAVILESPWVRYRLGHFNVEGLLLNYSHLYRYWGPFKQLLRLNFEDALRAKQSTLPSLASLTPLGQVPLYKVAKGVDSPPDPTDDSNQVLHMTRILSDFRPRQENLRAMEQLISLNGPGLQLIVVEMPVPDGFHSFFGNGRDDYQVFIDNIAIRAEQNDVPFLRTEPFELIPDDGWADYTHVNEKGAIVLSEWLASEIAREMIAAEGDRAASEDQ